MSTSTSLDDVKEWSGPFFDTQQLGIRLNFDVDIKRQMKLKSTSPNVKTAEWSGPFFDAHQLGLRLNFDVDVKILLSLTSTETNVETA